MRDLEELETQLEAIERDIDAHRYLPGPWARVLKALRARPRVERRYLAAEISRVSSKLHRRGGRRTISVTLGIVLELLATALGLALLEAGLDWNSSLMVIATALIWMATFQPLLKMVVGRGLGVRYEYFYLFGANPAHDGASAWYEPHVKMLYGTYLAMPRVFRILFHLSGCVGSPLALWLCANIAYPDLRLASSVCVVLYWAVVAINAAAFVLPLVGARRLGGFLMRNSSGGVAATEFSEGLSLILFRRRGAVAR